MAEYLLVGDGKTDNTAALQALLDMKGKLVLLRGEYMTGPLTVSSDTEIEFEEGAVLKFIADFDRYEPVYTRWEGVQCWCMHPCLFITGASNVRIHGKGVIDGNGASWWRTASERRNSSNGPESELEKKFAALNPGYEDQPGGGGGRQVQFLRPPLVQIHRSCDVTIEDVKITNSPFWTVHPVFSDRLTLRNLVIENPADAPNTDGIDIESSTNVTVDSCFVHVGDDGIALKSGSGKSGIEDAAPTSNVRITNCTVKAAHGGAVIGSETAAEISDVTVEDCLFDGTDRGIRIKTRRGRGGLIHDLAFRRIRMRRNLCPFVINMYYRCGTDDASLFSLDKQPVIDSTPDIHSILIEDCHGEDSLSSAGMAVGLPEMPIRDLTIRNSSFSVSADTTASVDDSDMYRGLPTPPSRGFRLRNVEVRLENVSVECEGERIIEEEGTVVL